jgi:hypothetical protein
VQVASPAVQQYAGAFAESNGLLYYIGGEGQGTFVEAYEIATNTWRSTGVAQLPVEGAGGIGVQLGNNAFIVVGNYRLGGASFYFDGTAFVSWQGPPANVSIRFGTGSVILDGSVYAVGGCDTPGPSETPLARVDAFTPPFDYHAWDTSPPDLATARCQTAAAVGTDGRIYSVGGKTGTTADTASTIVETWRPGETAWRSAASMAIARAYFGLAAAPDGRIYAAGGFVNASTATPTVEAYVPGLDRWIPVASMPSDRAFAGAVVGSDGRLFVIDPGILLYYGPRIAASPPSASPGATVLLSGSNFAANANVDVYVGISGVVEGNVVASGTTDTNGALNTPISAIIPAGTPAGNYQVVAIDNRSRYPVHIPFTVNP